MVKGKLLQRRVALMASRQAATTNEEQPARDLTWLCKELSRIGTSVSCLAA